MIFLLLLNIFCKLIPLTKDNFEKDLEHNLENFEILNLYCKRINNNNNKIKKYKEVYNCFLKIYNKNNNKKIKEFNEKAKFIFDAGDDLENVFN